MKKETWIRIDIWEKTKEGMKCTRFTKYIKGELLIPNEYTRILPMDNWEIIRHFLDFPNENEIISIIKLWPPFSESDIENINKAKKFLKENGYVEEDCY